eukprot:TRINITY_DN7421_c0_g2_i1.p1 TRINITY_DN7421_c0_g2~~TRINITY_DN7421_c0_g2_i1.p1  ORF type:complete len:263 (+),score=45.46 TRINITY_DN7421_c0_g2_i1:54-791(+)
MPRKILVVGDGDLSYSAALAEMVKNEEGTVVWGSVLPNREEQVRLYTEKAILEKEKRLEGRVLYTADLTNLKIPETGFDEVHFNYPHLGYSQQAERGGKWSRANEHVKFLGKMFESLQKVQTSGAKMMLTLTPTPPYSIKQVREAGIEHGYVFVNEIPFDPAEYSGYHPAWGDDRDISKPNTSSYGEKGRRLVFENCHCATCGIVCKGTDQIKQHLKSSRHDRMMRKQRSVENKLKPKRRCIVLI